MKNLLNSITQTIDSIASMQPTYCAYISYKMRKSAEDTLETVDVYYTSSGVTSIVRDKRDGQTYIVEVKPFKKG